MAITLVKGKKADTPPLPAAAGARVKHAQTGVLDSFFKPVRGTDVTFFFSQLALMLEVGSPLTVALKAIASEIKNPAFKKVVSALQQEIEEGAQLSEAMKTHPRVFHHKVVSMVKAGETGGFLKNILERIVAMQEKRQALIFQLRSSLTYPVFLCVLGVLVVLFILVFILPKFTAFFQGKESILPWTTRYLMMASASLKENMGFYILGAFLVPVLAVIWLKSRQGRAVTDRFLIGAPVISSLANKIYTCEMVRTLGYLMESQVPLIEALQVTRPTIWNRNYRRFIDVIIQSVDQGGRFAQPFGGNRYIPETVKQMLAVGEETGKLPLVMLRLAKYYDLEIEQQLKRVTALIEPIALVILGGVVGLIVSSIILPLFRLSQALS